MKIFSKRHLLQIYFVYARPALQRMDEVSLEDLRVRSQEKKKTALVVLLAISPALAYCWYSSRDMLSSPSSENAAKPVPATATRTAAAQASAPSVEQSYSAEVKAHTFYVPEKGARKFMTLNPGKYYEVAPGVVHWNGYTCEQLNSGTWRCTKYSFQ